MFHVKRLFIVLIFFATATISDGQKWGEIQFSDKGMIKLPAPDQRILETLNGNIDFLSLGQEQKEWFYWINYSRENPKRFWDSIVQPLLILYPEFVSPNTRSLKKELLSVGSLAVLGPHAALTKTAQGHASQIANKKVSISHNSADGTSFSDRMLRAGIYNCAGENISYSPMGTVFALVMLYVDEGVPELGHRKTLLNKDFLYLGIGIAERQKGFTIVVQDFACSQKL